jgi:hypothetical protein
MKVQDEHCRTTVKRNPTPSECRTQRGIYKKKEKNTSDE